MTITSGNLPLVSLDSYIVGLQNSLNSQFADLAVVNNELTQLLYCTDPNAAAAISSVQQRIYEIEANIIRLRALINSERGVTGAAPGTSNSDAIDIPRIGD